MSLEKLKGRISEPARSATVLWCLKCQLGFESVHASQIHLHFRCFVGKRHLEEAMKAFSDSLSFEVTWKPFFLNPSTPETGISLEQYLSKRYGASVAAMAKQGTGHLSKAGANVVKLIYL